MINFDLQPVQVKLFKLYELSKAKIIGFGGSRGGSKSITIDLLMIYRRSKYPGTNGLIIMRYYQDIWDIHLTPLFIKFPELRAMFNVGMMQLNLSDNTYVRFIAGDSLATFEERKGREFADVMVDQSELFTQAEIEFFGTINRSTNLSITPKILLAFNPGNIGHSYNKRVFINKIYDNNENSEDYAFLQTFGWDNAYWVQRSLIEEGKELVDFHKWDSDTRFNYFVTKSEYGKVLNALPEIKRKQELLGSMDVFEGQFFSEFSRKEHVIDVRFNPGWNIMAGLDYGNITVLEVLQKDYEGSVAVIYEIYIDDAETPSERANRIADLLFEKKIFNLTIIYDTDMESSQLSNVGFDKTPIQIFRHVFRERMGQGMPAMICVNKTSLDKNKGYRQVCNEIVKEYLQVSRETGQPQLFFDLSCKHLIEEISEKIIYDPKNPDSMDFLNSGQSKPHAYDSFKYALMQLYTPKKKPKEPLLSPRLQANKITTQSKTISSF